MPSWVRAQISIVFPLGVHAIGGQKKFTVAGAEKLPNEMTGKLF